MKKRQKRKAMSFEKKQKLAGYIFILPLIFGFCFLFLPNIIKTVIFSMNDIVLGNGSYTLSWKGLQYYHDALFVDANYIQYVIRSLGDTLINVPVIIIFSLFMASMLNQKFHGRVLARAIFFLPVVLLSGILTKIDLYYDLVGAIEYTRTFEEGALPTTAVSSFLYSLNFSEGLIRIVVNAANMVEDIVNHSGMQIFILLAAFQEVPQSSYEAAAVEGASKWEIFWKITVPSVQKQLILVAVYTVVDNFTRTDNALFTFIRQLGFKGNQYGMAMAMYIIYLLAFGIVLGIAMVAIGRAVRKGEA